MRGGNQIGAWRIEIRVRPNILEVRVPVANVRDGGAIARRDSIAQIHHHIARLLAEGDPPIGRAIFREFDFIITPVRAGHDAGSAAAGEGKVLDCARRQAQAVADIGIGRCSHRDIPRAGPQLEFRAAAQRHEVPIFADGAGQRPIVERAALAVIAVRKGGNEIGADIDIGIAADRS